MSQDTQHAPSSNENGIHHMQFVTVIKALPQQSKDHTDSQRADDTHHPEATNEWTSVLEAMAKHDERMLSNWKDDLSNLLVFAGLFSSVVTGFVVASYPWLQASGPDPFLQIQFLAQISSQLASLSLSDTFINSTTQPNPSITVPTPSLPTGVQIRINTLWFLSLAFSLVASLMAIVVQQWLREYPLPGHLTTRERVRLRQYRYKNLLKWGVPQIVSVLPVLLQVALVLFLSGLCYLLATLNDVVAKTFIAFVGVALFAYSASTILPIAFSRCPYRSPLADILIRAAFLMLSLLVACVVGFCFVVTSVAFGVHWLHVTLSARSQDQRRATIGYRWRQSVYSVTYTMSGAVAKCSHFVLSFGRSGIWFSRDRGALVRDASLHDSDALVWASSVVSSANLAKLDPCLQNVAREQLTRCVVSWAAQALDTNADALAESVGIASHPCYIKSFVNIDLNFALRFQDHLLNAFRSSGEFGHDISGILDKRYGPTVLALLRRITNLKDVPFVEDDFTGSYARHILSIRKKQATDDLKSARGWTRLPTQCLFDCSVVLGYDYTVEEISQLFSHTLDMLKLDPLYPTGNIYCLELILLSAATALHAVCRKPLLLQTHPEWPAYCHEVLIRIHGMLHARNRGYIRQALARTLKAESQDIGRVLRDIVPAVVTLGNSITELNLSKSLDFVISCNDSQRTVELNVNTMKEDLVDAFRVQDIHIFCEENLPLQLLGDKWCIFQPPMPVTVSSNTPVDLPTDLQNVSEPPLQQP